MPAGVTTLRRAIDRLLCMDTMGGGSGPAAPERRNRMPWKPMGRAATASILSLAMALGVTSCSNDYTVAYLYMTTAKTLPHGLINAYQINYQTGGLLALADSPVDAGGRNTVGMVVTPNNLFLYTVNHDDSDVEELAIGTDGKLYPENTYNITGSFATAAAIDAAGKFLYVTFTYQNAANNQQFYTPANPGPGGVTIFPINSDNSLGTPTTVNVGRNPVGIATSPVGNYVYVIEQDSAVTTNTTTGNTGTNNLLAFSENPSTGALTLLPGQTVVSGNAPSIGFTTGTGNTAATGAMPTAILADASGAHLYIPDGIANQVVAFSISSGIPKVITNTSAAQVAAPTESLPQGMTFDLTGKYLYVVDYNSNTVDSFAVGSNGFALGAAGQPVRLATIAAGTGPTCAAVIGAPSDANPSHAVYFYTSNALSNNITAEQLNPQTGALEEIQGEPFSGSMLPSCLTVVPALPLR
jgi:6-phosphogluconolactonase